MIPAAMLDRNQIVTDYRRDAATARAGSVWIRAKHDAAAAWLRAHGHDIEQAVTLSDAMAILRAAHEAGLRGRPSPWELMPHHSRFRPS